MAQWLYMLLWSILSGAANSIAMMFLFPDMINLGEGIKKMGFLALFGAIIGAMNYLKQSPLPKKEVT